MLISESELVTHIVTMMREELTSKELAQIASIVMLSKVSPVVDYNYETNPYYNIEEK